jgi:hypothetical protein
MLSPIAPRIARGCPMCRIICANGMGRHKPLIPRYPGAEDSERADIASDFGTRSVRVKHQKCALIRGDVCTANAVEADLQRWQPQLPTDP